MTPVHLHLGLVDPGGHGLLRALPRSYQVTPDIPNRRRATQRKVVRPNGRQPARESARRRSGTIPSASDITDDPNHNSKPRNQRSGFRRESALARKRAAGWLVLSVA